MKKKSLVALLLVLALACVPLVGCGESGKGYSTTKKLDLNDYTIAASDVDVNSGMKVQSSKKQFTTATVETGFIRTLGSNLNEMRYGSKATENGAVLYDFVAHTVRYADKAYDSIRDYNRGLIVCYSNNEDGSMNYDIYESVNLNLLSSFKSYSTFTYETNKEVYINGEKTSVYIYKYNASAETDKSSYKYYVRTEVAEGARPTYKEIAEADFKSTNVTVGSVVNAYEPTPVYDTNAIVTYADMEGYTYTRTSSDSNVGRMMYTYNYTFFKDGAKSGELTITDGMPLDFVDKYFYYNEFEPVVYDAVKGYNFVMQSDNADSTTAVKYNVTTYRYDITKNKTSKVELGYVPFLAYGLYNYADKKYDAMSVVAYGKTDGVASTTSTPYALIVDKDMKVGYDFTGKPFGIDENISKLKENRFISSVNSNTYIYNEKLEIVASFNTASREINDDLGLVIFNNGGNTMAVDYDGKVVFKDQYTNPYYDRRTSGLDFYGNYAVACVTKDNGETESPMIVSKDNLEGTKIVTADNERLYNGSDFRGLIVKVDAERNYTFTNYAGTVIHTVKVEGDTFDDLVTYFDKETGDQYAYFYYSDATGAKYTIVFTC